MSLPSHVQINVLLRVHAAGASIGDYIIVTGKPYLIRFSPFGGWPRPRNLVPGACVSGRVAAVGAKVTMFRPGDEVYGEAATGAFAEYLVVAAKLIAPKPRNLSFEEAAVTPWAVNALQGLRESGRLKAGHKVLINGASGGVGTWAVQIAKALGAHVTAVCSTRNVEMVRRLGADEAIDYTKQDFVDGGSRFDVVLDTVGNRSVSDFRSVLTCGGTFVSCTGGPSMIRWLARLAWMLLLSRFTRQKLITYMASPSQEALLALKEIVEAGELKPVIGASLCAEQSRRRPAARWRATRAGADSHPNCGLEPRRKTASLLINPVGQRRRGVSSWHEAGYGVRAVPPGQTRADTP